LPWACPTFFIEQSFWHRRLFLVLVVTHGPVVRPIVDVDPQPNKYVVRRFGLQVHTEKFETHVQFPGIVVYTWDFEVAAGGGDVVKLTKLFHKS
jgi:hypothetical protein